MATRNIVRQGDVLVVPVTKIPKSAAVKPRDNNNRVILAYGEVTGHAHAIEAPDACNAALLDAPNDEVYLTLDRVSRLMHEEHGAITLELGSYRVIRQREYTPEGLVNVED